jgi:hypothetical protein
MLPVTDDSKEESSMAPICALRGSIEAKVFLVQRPFKHREYWYRATCVVDKSWLMFEPGLLFGGGMDDSS